MTTGSLLKILEHPHQVVLGNADSRVPDFHLQAQSARDRPPGGEVHVNTAMPGVFNCISQQVDHDLAQLILIHRHIAGDLVDSRQFEVEPLGLGPKSKHEFEIPKQDVEVADLRFESDAAGLDPGDFQHVIDQRHQMFTAAIDDIQVFPLLAR